MQSVGHADLVIDLPLPLEVGGVLVELAVILPAHAVDDQVVVEVVGVYMLGHYDAGFTLRTYTHATRQAQEDAAQKMGNFMAQVM